MFSFSAFYFIWVLEVITTIMTSSYHFYFVVVPRRTSNLRKVRFGEVAVLKQILVLHRKKSWKFSEYLFELRFLVHMPQVISKLSLVLHFSILATEGPRKNRPLSVVLFWQISATICVCLSIALFFSSFDHGTFGEVSTVVYALYVVFLSWNLNQKDRFTIMLMLMLLIELCEVLYEGSFQV
jgi:drug/metabolite transporter (DMT)-like permease